MAGTTYLLNYSQKLANRYILNSSEIDNTLIKLNILISKEQSTALHTPQRKEGGIFLPGSNPKGNFTNRS